MCRYLKQICDLLCTEQTKNKKRGTDSSFYGKGTSLTSLVHLKWGSSKKKTFIYNTFRIYLSWQIFYETRNFCVKQIIKDPHARSIPSGWWVKGKWTDLNPCRTSLIPFTTWTQTHHEYASFTQTDPHISRSGVSLVASSIPSNKCQREVPEELWLNRIYAKIITYVFIGFYQNLSKLTL